MRNTWSGLRRWLSNPINVMAMLVALLPILLNFMMGRAYWLRQTPHIDEWTLSQQIAMKTDSGTLTIADLFMQNSVHRHVFSNILTVFLTHLNGWQIPDTIYIVPVIAIFQAAITILIFAKQKPRLLHLVLYPMVLFVFFPTQYYVWLAALSGSWVVAHTFMAGAVAVVSLTRPSLGTVIGAAFLSIAGILSVSVIFPVWVVIPVVMVLRGYRNWRYYLLWFVFMAVTIGCYFLLPLPVNQRLEILISNLGIENPTIATPGDIVTGMFVYMSASVIFVNFSTAVTITLSGTAIFLLNTLYLWRTQTLTLAQLAPWLGFAAFSVGGGILMLVGRASSGIHPIDMAKQPRFFTVSIWFWRSLFVLSVIVAGTLAAKRRRTLIQSSYLLLNIFTGVFIVLSISLTSIQTAEWYRSIYGHSIWNPPQYPNLQNDLCVRDFPLYRDVMCLSDEYDSRQHSQPDFIYQLAVYRHAIFHDLEAQIILPDEAPVIVSTDNEWLNLYVREFMLPEVPQLHLAEPAVWDDPSVFDPPLEYVLQSPIDSLLIHEFIEEHEELWYLTTPESVMFDVLVFDAAENYEVNSVPITHPQYADTSFSLFYIHP